MIQGSASMTQGSRDGQRKEMTAPEQVSSHPMQAGVASWGMRALYPLAFPAFFVWLCVSHELHG